MKALTDALSRRNIKGSVRPGRISGFYEIAYDVLQEDLVSVIIPTKNGYEDLKTCVDSIIEKRLIQIMKSLLRITEVQIQKCKNYLQNTSIS